VSLHSGGGWGDDTPRPVPTVGNGEGARTDIPRGEEGGGVGACRCMPVGEAVLSTRPMEGIAAPTTVAHSLFLLSGSWRKRRANDTDQV